MSFFCLLQKMKSLKIDVKIIIISSKGICPFFCGSSSIFGHLLFVFSLSLCGSTFTCIFTVIFGQIWNLKRVKWRQKKENSWTKKRWRNISLYGNSERRKRRRRRRRRIRMLIPSLRLSSNIQKWSLNVTPKSTL